MWSGLASSCIQNYTNEICKEPFEDMAFSTQIKRTTRDLWLWQAPRHPKDNWCLYLSCHMSQWPTEIKLNLQVAIGCYWYLKQGCLMFGFYSADSLTKHTTKSTKNTRDSVIQRGYRFQYIIIYFNWPSTLIVGHYCKPAPAIASRTCIFKTGGLWNREQHKSVLKAKHKWLIAISTYQ